MLTGRRFTRRAFQCSLYEAQDVLVDCEDVDLIHLKPGAGFRTKERLQRRFLYRDVSRRLVHANPGLESVRLDREYEVFVTICQNHWDFPYINAIQGWKERCKLKICWIDEVWAADIPHYKYWLHALNQFDHVFVGYRGTVEPLSKALGRQCHWMPFAVDALRFTPYPALPPRVVDVYSIGRRWSAIHSALRQAAAQDGFFYLYDTFPGADVEPYDHRQHREMLANIAKRSRFFMVAPGKVDASEETQGQIEVGYRYYEGAAAGAVMIGQAPRCQAFEELFPWPDAVVHIEPDGSDVVDVIKWLKSDVERSAAIGRRNAVEALLRHDWVYRWKEILRIAGLSPTEKMMVREARLRALAAEAEMHSLRAEEARQ
ncbi:MAG: glycosyltransferase [Bryobacterales bacterium]|nr:glycosyltransferase [Bryobacterales bacterium]